MQRKEGFTIDFITTFYDKGEYNLSQVLESLLQYENILNQYSGKRYHLRAGDDWLFSLVEVKKIGKKKVIVSDLTTEQMLAFFKRNLRVTLQNRATVSID